MTELRVATFAAYPVLLETRKDTTLRRKRPCSTSTASCALANVMRPDRVSTTFSLRLRRYDLAKVGRYKIAQEAPSADPASSLE